MKTSVQKYLIRLAVLTAALIPYYIKKDQTETKMKSLIFTYIYRAGEKPSIQIIRNSSKSM